MEQPATPVPAVPGKRTSAVSGLGSTFLGSALAVVLALAVGAIFIVAAGDNPLEAYRALLDGAFGGKRAIAETLVAATPMIFGGLAFAIAARAGMFNIGIQGQFVMGSLFAGLVAAAELNLPAAIYIPAVLLAGGIAGGLWGAIPGLLKARSGASEVITTIMLNYLAFRISTYAVTSAATWLTLVDSGRKSTNRADPDARLPIIFEFLLGRTRLHAGFLIALASALLLWYVLFRTTFGYRVRTVGLSRGAADYAGIPWGRTVTLAMFMSGMLGGLMGASETVGLNGRHTDDLAGYGFTAIAVGLVGRNHPIGIIFAGLLFGVLRNGANAMQQQAGTSKDLVLILQGLVILSISALAAIQYLRSRRASKLSAHPPAPPRIDTTAQGAPV
jgi:simple sugar transport system permease protein